MVSGSQYRVLDPATVIVYPDIFAKKKTFDLRGIKTFYLSNIKAEDARKMVQTVFRDEQLLIQEDPNLNALVIRADYNSLVDVERFLAKIDKEQERGRDPHRDPGDQPQPDQQAGGRFRHRHHRPRRRHPGQRRQDLLDHEHQGPEQHQFLPDHPHRGHELPGIGQQQQDPGQAQPARHRRRGDLLHGRRRSARSPRPSTRPSPPAASTPRR